MSEQFSSDTISHVVESTSDIIEGLYNDFNCLNETRTYDSGRTKSILRWIPFVNRLLPRLDEKTLKINKLLEDQKLAITYNQWHEISLKLDDLLNNKEWKEDPVSDLYDYKLIQNDLAEMKKARKSKDFQLLLYQIRTKWIRNLGNMGDISLYRHSHVGTKKLIEDYIEECVRSLDYLINDKNVTLDPHYLLGMLVQTRKNIGRTALVLSGGSTFGVFHVGVLASLHEENLLPRIISGSSSGSIIASIICSHTNGEVSELLRTISGRRFNIFGESDDVSGSKRGKFKRLLDSLSNLLKYGTLFDINGLKETMYDFIGDLTFREAYNMTGKILNITVSPASIHEQIRLINYLTAPNCLIWSVVCASCSLPGVFASTSIYEKDPKTNEIHEWNNDTSMKYVDGSVDNDLPIMRLSEMFNVDHIIAVQVNPHVVPILKASVSDIGGDVENEFNVKVKHVLNNLYDFFTCEIIHYLQIMNEMDLNKNLSNKLISILSQSYSGDITIMPDMKFSDFKNILQNPTPEFIVDFIVRGVRASWPRLTVIKNHCGVEFALDKAISSLRGKLISSNLTSKSSALSRHKDVPAHGKTLSYMLVNSPILKSSKDTPPTTPEKLTPLRNFRPRFEREHSGPMISSKKRNTIGGPTANGLAKKGVLRNRGMSTTSLSSLPGHPEHRNSIASPESPAEELFNKFTSRAHTTGEAGIDLKYTRRLIKKARSSSNFYTGEDDPDNNDVPESREQEKSLLKRNPYFELTETPEEDKKPIREEKDNATYPKVSGGDSYHGSARSSYTGLNKLKDMRTQNNSNYNLNSELFKSLNSPDIRRPLKWTGSKDFHISIANSSPPSGAKLNRSREQDGTQNVSSEMDSSFESNDSMRNTVQKKVEDIDDDEEADTEVETNEDEKGDKVNCSETDEYELKKEEDSDEIKDTEDTEGRSPSIDDYFECAEDVFTE